MEAMNKQFEYQLEKEEFSHETPLEINLTIWKMVLDKSTQTQDIFTGKIAASLGCNDDREGWHTYTQH
jgi:hypothetical protein